MGVRERPSTPSSHACRVVVGSSDIAAIRSVWPDVPIVALVDVKFPEQAILAQAAGADVVLPTRGTRPADDDPALALAVDTAVSLATRRSKVRMASRLVGHNLGQALSVVNLAAEVALGDRSTADETLTQIQQVVREASGDAWRAGRAHRSLRSSLEAIDLVPLARRAVLGSRDVRFESSVDGAVTLVNRTEIKNTIGELIENARCVGAHEIVLSLTTQLDPPRVHLTVSDDGPGFGSAQRSSIGLPYATTFGPQRTGLGLATIAEMAQNLNGEFGLIDLPGGRALGGATLRLTLPMLSAELAQTAEADADIDQATAQARILEGVVHRAPLSESLEAIVAAIERQLPGSKCSILLKNGQALHHGAGASLPEAYRTAIDGATIGPLAGSCGTAAYTGHEVIAVDIATDPRWVDYCDLALAHGLRSCWSTPILANGGDSVLGTFAVYRADTWSPDAPAVDLVHRFTHLAAVAIGHHRLFGALAASESRFRGAFEGATAGMALVSLNGAFLKVNRSLASMLGSTPALLLGRDFTDWVDPQRRAALVDAWSALHDRTADTRQPVPLRIVGSPHGVPALGADEPSDLWVSVTTSLIDEPGDDSDYYYLEVRDVTAARRHILVQRARDNAEAANRAKNEFLATVSHELRTPLNAILGFAQVMQMSDLDTDQRSTSIDHIIRAGEHLLHLIDELLNLALIEAGDLPMTIERLSADELIIDATEIVRPLADSRRIVLTVTARDPDGDSMSDLLVDADRQCARQILLNLLGNAIKYTQLDGRVDVECSRSPDGAVRITVADNGPGIAPDQRERLFQPFHRLSVRIPGQAEGTGLGLSVAARLAEKMHGRVGVDSELGNGSRFWFELPAGGAVPTEIEPMRSVGSMRPPSTAGLVLYIEDDPACVDLITAALALRPGVRLVAASSAAEGLSRAHRGDIDAVLLDVGLPDRSGWDVFAELRSAPVTAALPVVMLTAGAQTAPPGSLAPDFVFTKPLDISTTLRAIDLVLNTVGDDPSELVNLFEE